MTGLIKAYRIASAAASPLIPLWLLARRMRGKEDAARWRERFGDASKPRPKGPLMWLHAASVGEANSVLLLIGKLRERFPHVQLLLTTGTVTSAQLMASRLPKEVIHQYVPVDTPRATQRFIQHWMPDYAFWIESELWPNLIEAANLNQCFMGIINARMSERSFARWRKRPEMIGRMLGTFDIVFAQSEEDGKRLETLGAKNVIQAGNVKFDAARLPCDETELLRLTNAIASRPVWLAASTHPGEEAMVAQAHKLLAATRPQLLTIIVPRHPQRGEAIAQELKEWRTALRSQQAPLSAQTQIYIADTLGELGLFYRLSEIVFMGGSLVKHGGQNPLEPARLACAVVTGPHVYNFLPIYRGLQAAGACARCDNAAQLASQVEKLMSKANERTAMQNAARQWVESQGGASDRIIDILSPIFQPRKTAA